MRTHIIVLTTAPPGTHGRPPPVTSVGRLVEELRLHGASAVEKENERSSDDGKAFLVVCDSEPPPWVLALPAALRRETLERIVLLETRRAPSVMDDLEEWQVAAGVEHLTYQMWNSARSTGYGIAGRRDVVTAIGGNAASDTFASENYCIYGSAVSSNLMQALVEYLDALASLRSSGRDPGQPAHHQ